jgi:hypothetical protein
MRNPVGRNPAPERLGADAENLRTLLDRHERLERGRANGSRSTPTAGEGLQAGLRSFGRTTRMRDRWCGRRGRRTWSGCSGLRDAGRGIDRLSWLCRLPA